MSWSVAVGWGLLILGRRWRPEPGWIDGFGRALGYGWIGWGLAGLGLNLFIIYFQVPVAIPANLEPPTPE